MKVVSLGPILKDPVKILRKVSKEFGPNSPEYWKALNDITKSFSKEFDKHS